MIKAFLLAQISNGFGDLAGVNQQVKINEMKCTGFSPSQHLTVSIPKCAVIYRR